MPSQAGNVHASRNDTACKIDVSVHQQRWAVRQCRNQTELDCHVLPAAFAVLCSHLDKRHSTQRGDSVLVSVTVLTAK